MKNWVVVCGNRKNGNLRERNKIAMEKDAGIVKVVAVNRVTE